MSTRRFDDDPLTTLFRPSGALLPAVDDEPAQRRAPLDGAEAPEPGLLRPPLKPVARARPVQAGPDPRELAKILAKAAVAKAKASAPPAAAAPPAAPPKKAAAPVPDAPRGAFAAPPPKRGVSAAEAMDAARAAEARAEEAKAAEAKAAGAKAAGAKAAEAKAAEARAPEKSAAAALSPAPAVGRPGDAKPAEPLRVPAPAADRVADTVQRLIGATLPNAAIYVPAAIMADDRAMLRPLWKAHRARLLAEGDIERAISAASVISALQSRPAGALAVAHVVHDGGEFLGWFDLAEGAPIAAFPGARAWGIDFAI